MPTRNAQRQLHQALKTQKFEFELTRGLTSGRDLEALDRRIEATRVLLDWLSKALEPQPAAASASLEFQTRSVEP
jgi:hypothetical protein